MLVTYTAICGVQVLSGLRQSMPSMSIDNCARVSATVPSLACGQTDRSRSSRFANRHGPSSSAHKILIVSPLRPRKTKTCPENGWCLRIICICALSQESRAAYRSLLRRSKYVCLCAARSLARALQNRLQHCTVRAVFHGDLGAAWELNMNRACRDLRLWNDGLLSLRLRRRICCCQHYRQ